MRWRTPADLGIAAPGVSELRPAQRAALEWIATRPERFLLLNAPTGSGKSLIGRAAGAVLGRQAVYLASDLGLQDQFVREFPDAERLMGHQGRVLVHAQSYAIVREVHLRSRHRDRMLLYERGGRDEALAEFTSHRGTGTVLVGPSLKRGVDLPDDLCEAVVVLVVPKPDWGDARVQARAKAPGGAEWYELEQARELCQMTGRGVRHEADRCVSYILDSEFARLLARRRGEFPRWWLAALIDERREHAA